MVKRAFRVVHNSVASPTPSAAAAAAAVAAAAAHHPSTSASAPSTSSSFSSSSPFKVLTYNILANKYAVGGHHSYCDPRHLAWQHRRERIKAELQHYNSDILFLQEVEQRVFSNELSPWLARQGYAGRYLARQVGEVRGAPEGIALFYRKALFDEVEHRAVRFSDLDLSPQLRPPHQGQGSGATDFWSHWDKREEGTIMAALRHVGSDRLLIAAVTHLFWNPNLPDIKAMQAAVLMQQIANFTRALQQQQQQQPQQGGAAAAAPAADGDAPPPPPPPPPIVLGGDFNSLWQKHRSDNFDTISPGAGPLVSGVYTLLSEGRLPPTHPDHPASRRRPGEAACPPELASTALTTSGQRLASTQLLASGREPLLTTKTATFAGCLDYIFVTPSDFVVHELLELPYQQPAQLDADPLAFAAFPAIPNAEFPSDHVAMGATLRFAPNT